MLNPAILIRLKEFMNSDNLAILDRILTGLTDPKTPGYQAFWTWFRGGLRDPESYAKAYQALKQLVTVIRQSRGARQ